MKQPKVQKPRIFIDKEGNWFQDGIPIVHRWTYLYNNNLLQKDEKEQYFIDEGRGKIYISVEDTPFVVKNVDLRDGSLFLILNDETEEKLQIDTLYLNSECIPYLKVKNGRFDARFSRPAYYEIMKYLNQDDGSYYLYIGNKKIVIKQK